LVSGSFSFLSKDMLAFFFFFLPLLLFSDSGSGSGMALPPDERGVAASLGGAGCCVRDTRDPTGPIRLNLGPEALRPTGRSGMGNGHQETFFELPASVCE
jgi:hypothetical protein